MSIDRVDIVGTGNVATHVCHALKNAGIMIHVVAGRDVSKAALLASQVDSKACKITDIVSSDHPVILAVSDDAIADVSALLPSNARVAHTSGSAQLNLLQQQVRGVFYPLQSFTCGHTPDWEKVPFCIESNDEEFGNDLSALAQKLSKSVQFISSEERAHLHVAAVVVNNFTNHLYRLADEYLRDHQIDPGLLRPLILETARKLEDMTPERAQTGPARRGDLTSIQRHLAQLEDHPELHALYQHLSDNIRNAFHER